MNIPVLVLLIVISIEMNQAQRSWNGRVLQRKQGDCPPFPIVSVCRRTCLSDYECDGVEKCCRTACGGTSCLRPVTERVLDREKPGDCPKRTGPWVCTSRCVTDSDCRGDKKCCRNRCGALACLKPEELNNDIEE